MKQYLLDIGRLTCVVVCASLSGLLFLQLGLPAPFLLGATFGVWAVTALIKPVRPYMAVPRWFHKGVILGLGTLIGATFVPEIIDRLADYPVTVTAVLVTSVVATLAGAAFLIYVRGYEQRLAFFCALPGGQAELLAIARETVDKDYVVALCHLMRVAFVFCSVPIVLALVEGQEAVAASNSNLQNLPGLFELPPLVLLQFFGTAVVGYCIAKLIRLPMPHMLGPLLTSMACHLLGLFEFPRIYEFVFLAQVTIGGAVGARLGQVDFRELAGYLIDAFLNLAIILAIFLAGAWITSLLVDIDIINLMLAYIPGGLYEVTVLSLVFGFDIAFVATHHVARVLLVLGTIAWLPVGLKKEPEGSGNPR